MLNPYYCAKQLEYHTKPRGMCLPEPRELVTIVNQLIKNLDKEYRTLLVQETNALKP